MTALILFTDNKIRACVLPPRPDGDPKVIGVHAVRYAENVYNEAVKAAIESAVECEDQDVQRWKLIIGITNNVIPSKIEPLKPYEVNYRMEVKDKYKLNYELSELVGRDMYYTNPEKVCSLIPLT